MTLLALLQARNEERFLPGWLVNLAEVVDGIVALDDGSDDTTAEILSAHPKVIELIRKPHADQWDERGNHMALIKAGRRHGAAWFLCIDADERVERRFGPNVADLIAREDVDAYSLRLRELGAIAVIIEPMEFGTARRAIDSSATTPSIAGSIRARCIAVGCRSRSS